MKLSLLAITVVILIVGVAGFEIIKDKKSYIIKSKKYHRNASQLRANRHRLSSSDIEQILPSEPFVTTIELGTSEQVFTVSLETAFDALWLADCERMWNTNPNVPAFNASDPNSSATDLGWGLVHTGIVWSVGERNYSDVVTLFEPTNQTFIKATGGGGASFYLDYHNRNLSGAFGLSWDVNLKDEQVTNNSAPILNLFAAAPQLPRFFVQAVGKNPTEDYSWSVTSFGSELNGICDQTVVTSAALSSTKRPYSSNFQVVAPEFRADSFSLGQTKVVGDWVVVDSSLPIIILPDDAFDVVYQLIQPDFSYDYLFYTTDCTNAGKLDDFVFNVNGVELRVPSTSYIYDVGLNDGQCALAIQLSTYFTDIPYVLGTPIQYHYCIKFDIDNSEISFQKYLPKVDEATTVAV
ncbi:Peptidase A1 domain-containing protein [Aphelenchoides besseyi]|nr:Peptidase A1 domain-containing protein [Aphelenchoides besseyi]